MEELPEEARRLVAGDLSVERAIVVDRHLLASGVPTATVRFGDEPRLGPASVDEARAIPGTGEWMLVRRLRDAGQPDDLVFKPAKGEGVIALSHAWQDIRAEAQLPEGLVLHGLRHGLASMMATQGAEAAEIMAALGHRQLSTAQRYIDIEKDERASLVERHTKGIAAAMVGKKKPAKVARISKRTRA